MLADMAVAVHPDDERYASLVGKQIRHPLTGRLIPIVADEHADPELGSGAVKVTPGHDFNDFEGRAPRRVQAGRDAQHVRWQAKVVQTADGLIPADLIGLSREAARKAVVDLFRRKALLRRSRNASSRRPMATARAS
jgi:valyl-tRNA synthetase